MLQFDLARDNLSHVNLWRFISSYLSACAAGDSFLRRLTGCSLIYFIEFNLCYKRKKAANSKRRSHLQLTAAVTSMCGIRTGVGPYMYTHRNFTKNKFQTTIQLNKDIISPTYTEFCMKFIILDNVIFW